MDSREMEALSESDIKYILAAYGAEESQLIELTWEFDKWSCDKNLVLELLRELIEDDIVGVTTQVGEEYQDFDLADSISVVSSWENIASRQLLIYMTDKGYDLWDNYDWNITKARASHLMFSNQGKVTSK